jgi:hypothetical protein
MHFTSFRNLGKIPPGHLMGRSHVSALVQQHPQYVLAFLAFVVFFLGLAVSIARLMGLAVAIYLLAYMAIEAQLRYVIPVASIILAIASIGICSVLSIRLRSATR